MIYYNDIEIFPKEVCDEMSFHRYWFGEKLDPMNFKGIFL
jgi:hypothetical protein